MNTLTQTEPNAAVETALAERKAKRFWLTLIVGLLSAQVAGGVATVYLATSDSSFSVVPDYYQAGLNWDITKKNRDLFTYLGWSCSVKVSEADPELKHRSIVVQLRNQNNYPVPDLKVTGQVYHHARANNVYSLKLDQAAPGDYIASIKLQQAGLWQVNLKLEGDHGIAEESVVVNVDSR